MEKIKTGYTPVKHRLKEWFHPFTLLTLLATAVILLMLFLVVGQVVWKGLDHISWSFIANSPGEDVTSGGIFPAIFGTAAMVLMMTVVVVPMGVITAVYLTEYAKENKLTRIIRLGVNNLAGVPPIVFGLFGVGFFINFIGKGFIDPVFFPGETVYGKEAIIWASLTLALLTLPVVIIATEEALKNIPKEIREGSAALGARKYQTIIRLVLPNARSGILTGAILAVSRGAGEVAPILLTGIAYYTTELPENLSDKFIELGYQLYSMVTNSANNDQAEPVFFATALVMLTLTFTLNILAILLRYHFRKRIKKYS